MQNMKKWIAAVLALALILAPALSTTAFAAVDDTGFSDVSTNDWYAEAVMYCHENELMSGTGGNAFSPNATMTRAMLATVLWRIADEPVVNYLMQFSDVAGNDWYAEAVRWAAGLDMLWEEFDPNAGCSRADAVWYMWNANLQPEADLSSSFQDVPDTSVYADAVNWAVSREITKGTGETAFDPGRSVPGGRSSPSCIGALRRKTALSTERAAFLRFRVLRHVQNQLSAPLDAHQAGVQGQVVVLAHAPVPVGVVLVIGPAALVLLLQPLLGGQVGLAVQPHHPVRPEGDGGRG